MEQTGWNFFFVGLLVAFMAVMYLKWLWTVKANAKCEASLPAEQGVLVYVAGPLSKGDMALNIRAAIDAANELREMGYVPFVPHLSFYWHTIHHRPYEDWIAMDLEWLARCQIVVRLPGESVGADIEEAEANRLGIPICYGVEALRYFREHGLKPLQETAAGTQP